VRTVPLLHPRGDRRCRDRASASELDDISIQPSYDGRIAVRQALETLDERSRRLCTLLGMEQRSYEEVSAAMNLPVGSIGPLYIRARQKMQKALAA
jgi:DNA-directed RNA polymerase specialized sigma24 family protein